MLNEEQPLDFSTKPNEDYDINENNSQSSESEDIDVTSNRIPSNSFTEKIDHPLKVYQMVKNEKPDDIKVKNRRKSSVVRRINQDKSSNLSSLNQYLQEKIEIEPDLQRNVINPQNVFNMLSFQALRPNMYDLYPPMMYDNSYMHYQQRLFDQAAQQYERTPLIENSQLNGSFITSSGVSMESPKIQHPSFELGSNSAQKRKKGTPIPEELKDEGYWERRRKNNEAAKRSRDAKKARESEIAIRASFLEQENFQLRVELNKLHALYKRI